MYINELHKCMYRDAYVGRR